MSELKDRIESIVQKKLAGEPVRQSIGIRAEFQSHACLNHSMPRYKDEATGDFVYLSEEFVDLVDEQHVIHFVNASVSGTPNAQLSGRSEDGLKLQDVFHFDPAGVASLIYKPASVTREVSTDYTYIKDVKAAIGLLDQTCLNEHAQDVLKIMADPEYSFSLEVEERAIRNKILFNMPGFNDLVFDLIPAERKLRHEWTSNAFEVVAHSNISSNLLHGRRQFIGGQNNLIGMDISR